MALYPPRSDGWAESRRRAFEASMEQHFEADRLLLEAEAIAQAEDARLTAVETERTRTAHLARRAARRAMRIPMEPPS